ncbi:glycosyltransferase [Variovorax sp. J22R24]|uniref:glycosyltransferase family 2 protein n=1 Tax=Variovorax gracilis TaxID=3053502 RepID=UPI0025790B34|nr:glycosyltransferase [Variovorax sp. J22R24]MDM0108310.1 glycosyltransferase [Variovorax sp. J22R24]
MAKLLLNSSPRVSVVIPTRNSEKYLREALDSILGQTFADFEVLIVDDSSSDGTLDIIRAYADSRVKILTGPGKGLAAALNLAIREARGEFIARMDADDIADTTRVGKQVAFLDEHPEVGVCGTLFQQFMHGDAIHYHMENVRYIDMMMGCYIGHPTAMFRRELFAKHELFYDESMRFSEDYDLWSRAIRITRLANIPEVLLRYRRHNDSASIVHVEKMHALDVGVKFRMIDYLMDGLSQADAELVTEMLQGKPMDEAARIGLLARLIGAIKHEDLCSPIELVSLFHQLKPLAKEDLIRFSRDLVTALPIFVISFNHLTYLQTIIEFFEKVGFKNLHVIDNASTYPPLVEYLRVSPHKIHYMGSNYKHMVLFDSLKFKDLVDNNYFVLTDPDVLPVDECPHNFLYVFLDILLGHPTKNKVGFSLKIDDIPDHYELKENVLKWEGRFYEKSAECNGVTIHDAPVDTTFALYRPRKEWRTNNFFSAFRTGAPFTARHLPWYRDISQLTDEEAFYRSVDKGSSNWNGTMSSEQLHKKYGTGKTTEAQAKEAQAMAQKAAPRGDIKETFRRRRIGELRGYFLYGYWPLLNLRTVPYESIRTTLYVFGKIPLISKTTAEQHHVYRIFGLLPIWSKAFS